MWTLRNHEYSPLGKFDVDKFFRQLAVGTGVGVRYDMDERRRTEIARCLAIDPKFIMLDEPFAGVDRDGIMRQTGICHRIMNKVHAAWSQGIETL